MTRTPLRLEGLYCISHFLNHVSKEKDVFTTLFTESKHVLQPLTQSSVIQIYLIAKVFGHVSDDMRVVRTDAQCSLYQGFSLLVVLVSG